MKALITLLLLLSLGTVRAADLFVEAESFSHKGGWVVDQQFMDLMGSPYLLAHGMGEPVDDAYTEVTFLKRGSIMYMSVHITGLLLGKKEKGPVNSACR